MKLQPIVGKKKEKPKKKPQTKNKLIKKAAPVRIKLSDKVSEHYKGTSDSILGVLDGLPKNIKTLFNNSYIKTMKLTAGESIFILDNSFTFIIKDIKRGKKHLSDITIKQGKKRVFHAQV